MASSIPPLILAPAKDTRRQIRRAVLTTHASGISHQYSAPIPPCPALLDTEPSTSPAFFKETKCPHYWTTYCTDKVPPLDEDFFTTTIVPRTHTCRLCSYARTTNGIYIIRHPSATPIMIDEHLPPATSTASSNPLF